MTDDPRPDDHADELVRILLRSCSERARTMVAARVVEFGINLTVLTPSLRRAVDVGVEAGITAAIEWLAESHALNVQGLVDAVARTDRTGTDRQFPRGWGDRT